MTDPATVSGRSPILRLLLAALPFAPGLLAAAALLLFVYLPLALSGAYAGSLPDLLVSAALFLLAAFSVAAGIFLGWRMHSPWLKLLLAYAFCQPLALLVVYTLAAMLAGASMAVVDGAAAGWSLKLQELEFALMLLLPMQVLILPWVLLTTLLPGWLVKNS